MANFITFIGDKQILLEAPVAGAFAKSESEIQPDPRRALENMFATIRTVVEYAGEQIGPAVRKSGAAFELSFAVRSDSFGLVMLSESASVGQIQVSVKWPAMRPAGPAGDPAARPLPGPAPRE